MPLSVNFSVAQSYLTPESLTVIDTSTGTDVDIVTRRVFVQTAYGSYLVESGNTNDYTNWPEPAADLAIDVLNQDYAVSILVQWLNVSNAVVYSLEQQFCFTLYNMQFLYYLTQSQATGNANIQDTNYYYNKKKLITLVNSANNAVQYASDIVGGQNCLNAATEMSDNQNIYF